MSITKFGRDVVHFWLISRSTATPIWGSCLGFLGVDLCPRFRYCLDIYVWKRMTLINVVGSNRCEGSATFERYNDVVFPAFYFDKSVPVSSTSACGQRCMVEPEFLCRSFIYDPANQQCSMSHNDRQSLDRAVMPALPRIYAAVLGRPLTEYYEATCLAGEYALLWAVNSERNVSWEQKFLQSCYSRSPQNNDTFKCFLERSWLLLVLKNGESPVMLMTIPCDKYEFASKISLGYRLAFR